jgi:hypothetical protein
MAGTDRPDGERAHVVAVPEVLPANPAGHESHDRDRTSGAARVPDGGITTAGLPGPASSPGPGHPDERGPGHPDEPAPVTAAAGLAPDSAAAGPVVVRRRRRRWTIGVAAVAAALGLIAGLVIWAPWRPPPLLQPTGLAAGRSTISSVTLHWSGPATGPAPDRYVILNSDGRVIGSVPGTVTSYQATGLGPATTYWYQVAAVRGSKRSETSFLVPVTTSTPPVSAARWQGSQTVTIKIVRGGAGLVGPKEWTESWLARPSCPSGPCAVRLSGSLNGHFAMTLTRAGAVYQGKVTANVFPCGSGAYHFPIQSIVAIRITITTGQPDNRAWVASAWTGTMVVSSPYTSSGSYYCPASRITASLWGG